MNASTPLFSRDPEPCFASNQAQLDVYDSIWFSRISINQGKQKCQQKKR
jgi:hypothetical protein